MLGEAMTIKIKAPKAWLLEDDFRFYGNRVSSEEQSYRIVRESDWRKLMALVKAMETHCNGSVAVCDICEALEALEKKK